MYERMAELLKEFYGRIKSILDSRREKTDDDAGALKTVGEPSVIKATPKVKGAPRIEIFECNTLPGMATVYLSGKISDDEDQKPTVTVNNKEVYVYRTGEFSRNFNVAENQVSLEVIGRNSTGGTCSLTVDLDINNSVPVLKIDNSPESSTIKLCKFKGTLTDEVDPFPSLSINGDAAIVSPRGMWSHTVELTEGDNLVRFVAQNKWGKTEKQERRVTYIIPPPVIALSNVPQTPMFRSVRIAGNVADVNDRYPSLDINGINVHVTGQGNFSMRFKMEEGLNVYNITATNMYGKTSRATAHAVFGKKPPNVALDDIPSQSLEPYIKVSGSVVDENDANPTATLNGEPLELDMEGRFTHRVRLMTGVNDIKLVGKNEYLLVSSTSKQVKFDAPVPELTVNPVNKIVDQRDINITGTLRDVYDEDITVTVKTGTEEHTVFPNQNGQWGVKLLLAEGENSVTVTSVNAFKAQSQISFVIHFHSAFDYKWYRSLSMSEIERID